MRNRLLFILKYFLFWFSFFLVIRALFLIFNFTYLKEIPLKIIPQIYLAGFRLDISASSYILILPFLLVIISMFIKIPRFTILINVYTYLLLVIFSFLTIVDMELYQYWGFRLDTTPLQYIHTPGAMLASITFTMLTKQLVIGVLLVWLFIFLYRSFFHLNTTNFQKLSVGWLFIFPILLFTSLIIPIRGGIGLAPLNTGSAYFSTYSFANHAAINVVWNVGFALLQTETRENPYKVMNNAEAEELLFASAKFNDTTTISLINNSKPNILLIVLESFSARLIPALGGIDSIEATPNFNKLIKEGVFFTNFYATGTRSDKGLISLLTGFPSFPNVLVMRFPDKTEKLPALAKDLKLSGYSTAYYYGGDIDFVSMRSFVRNAGFQKTISMSDFPSSTYNAKWGVHDHVVFDRLARDLDTASKPFFYTFFTLSSHEPFDVPMETVIKGNDDDSKFLNSVYYTDKCLGEFISIARTKPWWKNTLIILVADHGVLRLGVHEAYDIARFHIPMLWIGGAVKKDTIISAIGSQTDLPVTLLKQLHINPSRPYKYSRNILSRPPFNGYALGVYNSGFIAITPKTKVVYDYTDNKIKYNEGEFINETLQFGKAYLQYSYDDFLNLK